MPPQRKLVKTWHLADGTTYCQPDAQGLAHSFSFVCKVCGEVYAKQTASIDTVIYEYRPIEGCCPTCPAPHMMITPGYMCVLSWDTDWPLPLAIYHLNLLLDEFSKGKGRFAHYAKQGLV